MRSENSNKELLEFDGRSVKVTSYEINGRFLTEIEAASSGATLGTGIAFSREASRREAFATAARRLFRNRLIELTVGG